MRKVVECVPNFSEGRRKEVIDQILEAMSVVPGAHLLDVESDPDHNRTVVSLVGTPEAMEEAAFQGTAVAVTLIDMRQHQGAHPRIGAMDVIPFIPVSDMTMQECVEMARRLGERIARELDIPVYLYEEAATRPERRNLADVRKGQYEGLSEEIATNPDRAPDFGPAEIGPAGAVVIGARPFLIAFNVNLNTSDLAVAKAIAKAVRHSSGGYRYVKALGVPAGDVVQVSMNMTDYHGTPLHRALETIRCEAARRGVAVIGTEIVGITPVEVLTDAAKWYLSLHTLADEQILENRLGEDEGESDELPTAFLDAVAASTATPGGGSVSALAGALGAALVQMYAGLTIGKPKYADVEEEMQTISKEGAALQAQLADLVREDSQAYDQVMQAYALPKESDADKAARTLAIQEGLIYASEVPMRIARLCVDVLELVARVVKKGNVNSVCDGGVASYMAHGALRGALINVQVNGKWIKDKARVEEFDVEGAQLLERGTRLAEEIDRQVREHL